MTTHLQSDQPPAPPTTALRLAESGELGSDAAGHELPEFATVMRGYDRGQVDDFVTRLQEFVYDAELRATNAERRVAQAQRRMEDLERELSRAAEQAASPAAAYDDLGERIATILRLAAEESEALRSAAREQAEQMLEESRREREQQRQAAERELGDISRRRDGVVAELGRVRDVLTALGLSGGSDGAPREADPQAVAAAIGPGEEDAIDLTEPQAADR